MLFVSRQFIQVFNDKQKIAEPLFSKAKRGLL